MNSHAVVEFDDYQFDLGKMELSHQGYNVFLQRKSAEVLAVLLKSHREIVSRDIIKEIVWKDQVIDFDQNINFCIKCIRNALNDNPRQPRFIQTIPRKGYQFIAEIRTPKTSAVKTHHLSFKTFYKRALLALVVIGMSFLLWMVSRENETKNILGESSNSMVEQDLKRALYLFNKGDSDSLKHSIPIFERVLTFNSQEHKAMSGLAIALVKTASNHKDKEKALEYAHWAISLAPESGIANLAKGITEFYINWNLQEAYVFLKDATKYSPDSIMAWHELSVIQTIEGDLSDAESSISMLMQLDPGRAQEVFHTGWFYLATKRYQLALAQFQKSVELDSNRGYSHLYAGEAASKLGLNRITRDHWVAYMKIAGANEDVCHSVGQELEQGNFRTFYKWRLDYMKKGSNNDFSLAMLYAQLNDLNSSERHLENAVASKSKMVPLALVFNEFELLREQNQFNLLMSQVTK